MSATSGSRAGWYAGLALIAALLLGGAGGWFIGSRPGAMRPKIREMTLLGVTRSTLLDSLGLRPGQRALIDSLLDATTSRAESSVQRMMVDVRAATQAARTQVRAALDEPQRLRFDSMLSRVQELRPRSPIPPRGAAPQ